MKRALLFPVLLLGMAMACDAGGNGGTGGGDTDASADSAAAGSDAADPAGSGGGTAGEGGSAGAAAGAGGESGMDGGGGSGGEPASDAALDGALDGGALDGSDGGAVDGGKDGGQEAGSDAADGGGDSTPPSVQSVSPLDSATGVTADTSIVITFSEPMDTASVLSAYQSTDLPSANATFLWSAGDSVLTIDPDSPLPYASGTDPDLVSAEIIAFSLSTAATDKAGNPMATSFNASFSTLRDITQTLAPVPSLRGHVRSDDDVTGVLFVGDTNFNLTNRGFLSYALATVPDGISVFDSATLTLSETQVQGSPYSDLGTLRLRSIEYSALDSTAYNASYTLDIAIPESGSEKNLDVLSFVQADLTAGDDYSQYRLEFTTLTDSDSDFDSIIFSSTAPLVLQYLIP